MCTGKIISHAHFFIDFSMHLPLIEHYASKLERVQSFQMTSLAFTTNYPSR